ncbi:arrestin domain-containing protein 17 [Stomoxys calcitrans]|uniref:arrestin domain-containing protein 17 n=1 Tax=Stomoxys calcitrans TaxID=35570 RepID=UPI0027E225FE|nr:arrestin domain-containing protein 17 [Stomoxys calcitrans]
MPSTCEFKLDRQNGVYFAGQSVSGSILLTTSHEKRIRDIRIRFLGEAKVHWTEFRHGQKLFGNQVSANSLYRAHEIYVDQVAVVRREGIMPAGAYNYKFQFRIPKSCPTSCAGNHGHIRYILWLVIARPYRPNSTFRKPITVLRKVNLNISPRYKMPVEAEEMSSTGCLPCYSGRIFYSLRVPFGAYASGQTLKYSLKIRNLSMTEIYGYQVEFVQWMTFIAKLPRYNERKIRTVVASHKKRDSCLRLSNRQFEGKLILPSLTTESSTPTTNDNSNRSYTPAITSTPEPAAANETGADGPPAYEEILPPSFEQAMSASPPFIDPDDCGNVRDSWFRPLYPMFPDCNEGEELYGLKESRV